jgi:hypothetical protein
LFTISFSLIKIFTNHHRRRVPKSMGIGVSNADTELRESFVRLLRPLDCPPRSSCAWADGGP